METYKVELTNEEMQIIKDALNHMDVKNYYPKIDKAEKKGDKITAKFYHELVNKNLDLFCKMHKAQKALKEEA